MPFERRRKAKRHRRIPESPRADCPPSSTQSGHGSRCPRNQVGPFPHREQPIRPTCHRYAETCARRAHAVQAARLSLRQDPLPSVSSIAFQLFIGVSDYPHGCHSVSKTPAIQRNSVENCAHALERHSDIQLESACFDQSMRPRKKGSCYVKLHFEIRMSW